MHLHCGGHVWVLENLRNDSEGAFPEAKGAVTEHVGLPQDCRMGQLRQQYFPSFDISSCL